MGVPRDVILGLRNGALIGLAVLALGWPLMHFGLRGAQGQPPGAPSVDSPAAGRARPMPSALSGAAGRAVTPDSRGDTWGDESRGGGNTPLVRQLDLAGQPASAAVRRLAGWVVASADNGRRPFVILDKRQARLYVFEPGGRLAGASAVLLGYAAGDDTVPGIGERPIEQVRPQERTTPAGRFIAEPGLNAQHEEVVWVDYDAAVSMHRVRATNPRERRLQRLASATAADNRISYGCINLPAAFFDEVLWPRLRAASAVVYVLPEVKPLEAVFPGLTVRAAGAAVAV